MMAIILIGLYSSFCVISDRPAAYNILKKEGIPATSDLLALLNLHNYNNQQQTPFYGHYTGQPALASTSS